MNLRSIDLNLLTVFVAIMNEQNITRAAHALGMSQPAMSNALSRLRDLCQDPLFVRTARGMLPTARAKRLAGPVQEALALIEQGMSEQARFDYERVEHCFRIATSDYGEAVVLPRLLDWLQSHAPGIVIEVFPIQERELGQDLRSGAIDLAVGYLDFLDEEFPAEGLLTEGFSSLVRSGHPHVGASLTLEQFLALRHVIVTHPRRKGPIIDEMLAVQGLKRRVAVRVPSFLAVPVIIGNSNLIATLPQRIAQSYAAVMDLRLLETPLPVGRVEIRQYWHERNRNDAANVWLRETVAALCGRI